MRRSPALVEIPVDRLLRNTEVRRENGKVPGHGAARPVEFAYAVHRVVIVEGKEKRIAGREGVCLADELQGMRRVGRKDRHVLLRRRVEKGEHPVTAPLDALCGDGRCRIG